MLTQRGAAYVLGVDREPMVVAARDWQREREDYRVADVQALEFLDWGSFDLCVSCLNQCDLPDFMANN